MKCSNTQFSETSAARPLVFLNAGETDRASESPSAWDDACKGNDAWFPPPGIGGKR